MIYLVEIEGQNDLKVELTEARRGVWKARVGEHEGVELEFRGRAEDGAYLMVIGGETRRFHLDKNCTKYLLDDGQRVSRFQVEQAGEVVLEHERQVDTEWEHRVDSLASTITGIVLEVLVKPGERVEEGQPVILIEAMKMENTLCAPMNATVADVAAEVGQTVYAGDELVTFR
jgi:biotin carboxyl carrier protein